jgi:hypothetical protein
MSQRNLAWAVEALECRQLLSTSVPAYLIPTAPGVELTPLLTTGDHAANGYRMVGIPDGLGALDNGDGTFTVLMNHELRSGNGVPRAHGNKGAFVSKWVIDKATGAVLSGQDQIRTVFLFDPVSGQYVNASPAFNRFCSATLAEQTAFFNPATGRGTQERIFTNGEEAADGRAFAHVVSSGESYQLARLGRMAYENVVSNPFPQDLTVVGMQDDSSRLFASEGAGLPDPVTGLATEPPSEVYFYVGYKQSTGSVIDRAGLTNGTIAGLKVVGSATEATVHSGDRFTLADLGDVSAQTPEQFETASQAAGTTQFRRPEDGSWDPTNRNVYYFVTTDIFAGDTRLWKLTFDDIRHPELGGRIEIAQDSPASKFGEMFDNVTVNGNGDVLIQEDVGNNVYLGQILQHDASTGDLFAVAKHDPRFFLDTDPATPGVQPAADADPYMAGVQGTQDEESSGIIDVSSILGPNHYLTVVQAHYTNSDPELVEGGQLLILNTDAARAELTGGGVLRVSGTVNDDRLSIEKKGNSLWVSYNGRSLGTFEWKLVQSINVAGSAGSDVIRIDGDVNTASLVDGGLGDDVVSGGGGASILVGGAGRDVLLGNSGEDVLVGDAGAFTDGDLAAWTAGGSYNARVNALRGLFNSKITEDNATDLLMGGGDNDWFFAAGTDNDVVLDRKAGEAVN